jgi:hypothetical protein
MSVLICGRKIRSGKYCYARVLSFLLWLPCAVWGSSVPKGITDGDLVFRTGDEAISAVIRTLDTSGFSHVGMLYFREGEPFIIHSTPAEHEGVKDGVVIDSLDFFISRSVNKTVSYYHINSGNKDRTQVIKRALAYLGTPFSVTGEEGIYCTALVAQVWKQSDVDIITGTKTIHLPGLKADVIFPENIINSENVRHILPSEAAG